MKANHVYEVRPRRDKRGFGLNSMKTLLTTLLSFTVLSASAVVYNSDGTVQNIQAIHNNQAVDGDTIMVPAGTFSWTARLVITKGITLQGQTTISGAGTANPIINDGTIVRDDTPRSGAYAYILAAQMATGTQSFRLTGITFTAGTTTVLCPGNGPIRLHADTENKNMRVDHCHFDHLYQTRCIWVNGGCLGVADHNVMERRTGIGSTEAFLLSSTNDRSWADYPRYGTDKFFFVEDNTIEFGAATDTDTGARFVFRHNHTINAVVTGHGTEGGTIRGGRVNEVYDNTFNWTQVSHVVEGGQRSGTCLWHDNIATGTPASVSGKICTFGDYRLSYIRPDPLWGLAIGTSVWDANDTEGNGTFVEGHPPFLFASGSATRGTTISGISATFTDSTRNWASNQWVGYSIKKVGADTAYGSYITANTANTITYYHPQAGLGFNIGDQYQIHRVLVMMDQNGGGRSDLIQGSAPINTTTGTASYAHTVKEPCYSWNNIYQPTGAVLGFSTVDAQPTPKLNIDYFNLGGGFPADTTPAVVSSRYTAALNGVAYTGTFAYPHPLVSGQPTPTPSPTATPSPTVTTNPATNIASFAAALNGSVNPRGSTTTVYFQWGTTTSYGHTTSTQTQTGNTSLPITTNISGLSASHLYHFRIVATNGGGTSFGSDRTFTTLSATGPPVVTTNPATNITTSSARLNGTLNPHGLTTTVRFQWGTTTSYGHTTPMQTQTGNTYRNIPVNISGLATHTTYHFRIVATNSAGTRFGIDRTFKTP